MATTSFESLVALGERLCPAIEHVQLDDCEPVVLASLVEQNRPLLQAARQLLGLEICQPVEFTMASYQIRAEARTPFRNLARAFYWEAHCAGLDHDYAAASDASLCLYQISNALRRGGLVVDALMAIAYSRWASNSLSKIRVNLSEPTRQQVIHRIQQLEQQREPFDQIYARYQAWEKAVYHPRELKKELSTDWKSVFNDDEHPEVPPEMMARLRDRLQELMKMSARQKNLQRSCSGWRFFGFQSIRPI
jgi:hypothetical protein